MRFSWPKNKGFRIALAASLLAPITPADAEAGGKNPPRAPLYVPAPPGSAHRCSPEKCAEVARKRAETQKLEAQAKEEMYVMIALRKMLLLEQIRDHVMVDPVERASKAPAWRSPPAGTPSQGKKTEENPYAVIRPDSGSKYEEPPLLGNEKELNDDLNDLSRIAVEYDICGAQYQIYELDLQAQACACPGRSSPLLPWCSRQ